LSQVQVSLLEQAEASKEVKDMTTQLLPYQGVVVGKGGLEPPPLAGHDPKSCAQTPASGLISSPTFLYNSPRRMFDRIITEASA
jgi:hypothetical protein